MSKHRTRISIIGIVSLLTGLLPVFSVSAVAQTPAVSINEIRIDQPSTDNDEYFELAGAAGTSLDGLTYLVIGDGSTGSGTIENVTDLTGQSIDGTGFFLAAESSFTNGTPDMTTSLNFENSDNVTHLLVADFTGSNGDDLDTDDDGTLDSTPWSEIVDSVALVESVGSGDQIYSTTTVGPDGSFVPAHVYLCSSWEIGSFDPSGGDDTPGAANACSVPAPDVSINEIRIDQSGSDVDEFFELTGAAGTSLDGLTYIVIGDGSTGSGTIENVTDLTGQSIDGTGFFFAAESSFTNGTPDMTTSLNFENSDNVTHLVVFGFTGSNGDDLDTDDDGTLDSTPWSEIVDSVALVESVGSGDQIYSTTTVGPDGSFVPAHVYLCGTWLIGSFGSSASDTAGAANDCPAPAVSINEIRIDQPGSDVDEYFELTSDAGTSLDGLTYIVIGDGSGGSGVIESITTLTGQTIPGDGVFVAAEGSFTLGTADMTATLGFENSDNVTHMLVADFTGSSQQDLDTDDDGTLDITPWSEIVDSVALVESVGSGDQIYSTTTVGPDGSFVPAHVYLCSSWEIGSFSGGDDTPGAANNCGSTGGGDVFGSCFDDGETKIHAIQGSGSSSPDVGVVRTIEGVVVGDFEGSASLGGFFVQEEDADADGDPATSEGIFVFNGSTDSVSLGDVVRVRGTVSEFGGMTQIEDVTDLTVCDTGGTVTTTMLTSPLSDDDREAVEGMMIGFTETLFVTDMFNLHTFGEVWLGMGGVIEQPTNELTAGPAADALAAANMERSILLDDLQNGAPSSIPFLHANGTLRIGDTTTDLLGVMAEGFGQYRIRPLTVNFAETNPRAAAPNVGGDVVVASFNVLNFWTTIGCSSCRGASTPAQLAVQTDKLVAAIIDMGADIVALQEIENTGLVDPTDPGDPSHDPIKTLVDALNAAEGSTVWAWVGPADHYNSYPIRNEIIYRIGAVDPVGTPTALADPAFDDIAPSGTPYARPPVAQTFEAAGAVFTVVNNHFKSKGSPCNEVNEGADGQGNCNQRRVLEAQALLGFVADLQAIDPDVLVVGDLNSYMREDPILVLEGSLTNLANIGEPYSFTFFAPFAFPFVGRGALDHGFGTASMASQVDGVAFWHINADEPRFQDWFDPSITAPGPYRSSDHDPLLIGLALDGEGPEVTISADPDELWPPNHKYRDVEVTITATDPSGPVTIELLSVTSSEPDSGINGGDEADDIVIVDDTHFELRAERFSKDGRVYTITYRATDAVGNETIASVEVIVPHDKVKKKGK